MPKPKDMGAHRRPGNSKATIKRLMSYFKSYRLTLLVVVISIILLACASVAGTALLKPLIDDCIVPLITEKTAANYASFTRILLIMGGVYAIGVIASYLSNRLMVNVSTGILCTIRKQMFDKTQDLPLSFFDGRTHGEIMSLYTNDTDSMREMISQGVPQLISSLVRVVSVFTMMIILSPLLTGLTVVMLAMMLFVVMLLAKRSGVLFKRRQASLAAVNGYMEEMIEGQKVVKVFCHEDEVEKHFNVINEELRVAASGANSWASSLMPIMGNLSYLHFAATAVAGAVLVAGNSAGAVPAAIGLSLGALTSFLQYTRNFSQPITQLSQQFNSVMSALAGAERVFKLLDESSENDAGTVTLVCANKAQDGSLTETDDHTGVWAWKTADGKLTELQGDVRFNNVTFSYDGEVNVLKNISFYAKPGQKIALVGSTGAGKTTITNLINRFYEVKNGSVTYDSIPVTEIKKSDLRRSLAMVLQDTHLFNGTVRDNIRYGKLDATDEEVINAAKVAGAHFFITHLPNGYDTLLTADGTNLSQGQRQLLAIARVAVADPPVLILDEATSSIDTRTEAIIERGMDALMHGRTVFVIAHRLSTVRNADAIMVLEHGEIIERGNHEELLMQKGRYYQLYTGAFELE